MISIPAIGVHTAVNPIGLSDDGTLAVPQPGPHLDEAAWFENSPTPGQPGPSIIEGHVDSTEGPSVFFKLGDVRPGDQVVVRRADGRVVTFRVDAVRDFLKARFPTRLVYGGKNLSQPTLRLITCSDFDSSTHHHIGNEVVFAHLVHATHAS
jgi:LPXTG-site transpeptidase (sortase) family protein